MKYKTHQEEIDEKAMYQSFNQLIIILLAFSHFGEEKFTKYINTFNFNIFGQYDLTKFSETDEKFELISNKIKDDFKLDVSERIVSDFMKNNVEFLGLEKLTIKLCKKKMSPLETLIIVKRFNSIYKNEIHEYKYKNYEMYTRIYDMKNGKFSKNESNDLYTKNSVFTKSYPFRN